MKLLWSPETASEAFIETVKACNVIQLSEEAELVSAIAAGHKVQLIVETWSSGGDISTSVGLAVARNHTGGKHICIVPDEQSKLRYIKAMQDIGSSTEVIVGEPEYVADKLKGVDFFVMDYRLKNSARYLKLATLSVGEVVVICRNVGKNFRWEHVIDEESSRHVAKSVSLPIGKGLDIAYLSGKGSGRWIKHVDRRTGEEHIILLKRACK